MKNNLRGYSMSLSTGDKVFLCIALLDLGGIFVWLGVALHLAYTKMDTMLVHLKNCPAITIRTFLISTGPWGRLHVLGMIMGVLVMPGFFLRDGGASAEDLKNFPVALKRKLVFMQWTNWILVLVMLCIAGVAKFARP